MGSSNKKLTINAVSAIIQVAFTSVLYFFLYKYLIEKLGVEKLGVWSLILSFSSIANLANMGITSGLVKFVAEYVVDNDKLKIGKLIFTSFVSMLLFFLLIAVVVFFASKYFLHYFIDADFLDEALKILPFSLASLSVNAISGVFTSVLEGFQKNYLRNFIYILSGILMFILTILLVPKLNLEGVAIAQLIQALFVFIFSLFFIFRISPYNRLSYWKWNSKSFSELFNYGYKFQVVSICQLLYEPTTKMLLSKFGGLAFLGSYEMASRLVTQVRALLVNANQVVIPVVAENFKTKTKAQLQVFFKNMNQILLLFTFPLLTLLIISAPIVSKIWIGGVDDIFIFSLIVLTIATGVNVMSSPSYFSCLGEGRLSILVFVHILMALINLLFGYIFGLFFGGFGVVISWGIALLVGSFSLIAFYTKVLFGKYKLFLSRNDNLIIYLTLFITLLSVFLSLYSSIDFLKDNILKFSLFLLFIPIIIKNTQFKLLIDLMKNFVANLKIK